MGNPVTDDLVSRLEDHGLFNKAERIAMFKEARNEIVRLRAALAATPAVGGADWSCVADFLDDIDVDDKGMCRWSDIANAQTLIRQSMRSVQPASPLRGREEIARIIDPTAFVMRPGAYGLKTEREMLDQTMVGVIRRMALQKADAILALASPPEQPAAPDKETFK